MPQTRASKMWHALVNHGIISNPICKIDRKTIHDFCGVRSFTHTHISSLDIEVCKDDLNAIRFLVRKSASTARQVFGSYLNKYIYTISLLFRFPCSGFLFTFGSNIYQKISLRLHSAHCMCFSHIFQLQIQQGFIYTTCTYKISYHFSHKNKKNVQHPW